MKRFIIPKDGTLETKQMFLRYRFCDLLNEGDINTILDVGAGVGLGAVYFAEKKYKVSLLENDKEANQICKYLFSINIERDNIIRHGNNFDAFYSKHLNVKYDMVLAMDFIQQTQDPIRTLCRLMDMTSKVLIFSFPISKDPTFVNDIHTLRKPQFQQFNIQWYYQKENGGISSKATGNIIRNIGVIHLRGDK